MSYPGIPWGKASYFQDLVKRQLQKVCFVRSVGNLREDITKFEKNVSGALEKGMPEEIVEDYVDTTANRF